ncbi:MAG: hypothetical protein BMS9Abin01_1333 [Gammaproteobacteria bacterium]|nr:MAG: hypothetical protein BMS9Abin01_1333 [Gammaproteobacteria bacterium]
MIRLFVLIGIVGGLLITYLATFAMAPEFQLAPAVSLLKKFEADGVIPGPNAVFENEEVEHGIFEVPAEDERQLEKAEAMAGMKMDGDGAMKMGSGLKIAEEGPFDREINLKMDEWRFSDMNIEVKRGERIRFNITNDGKIPHEFMFMTMPAMTAINYRVTRADWSLLEHEALYEKSLVLPDGEFSFVVEVQANGSWMFMCMLPYHMQMGMMGQMATPGMAMEMRM